MQKAAREAVAESAAAVADYRAGSERALNFIVGQVMKKTRGKADAGEVHRLVKAEVENAWICLFSFWEKKEERFERSVSFQDEMLSFISPKECVLSFPVLSSVISIFAALCTRGCSSSTITRLHEIVLLTLISSQRPPLSGPMRWMRPCAFIFSICIVFWASSAIVIIGSLCMSWIIFWEVFANSILTRLFRDRKDDIQHKGGRGHLPLFASELEMSKSLVRLEIIVDLAEIKKEEKR